MLQLSLSYSALSELMVAWSRVVTGFMNGPRIWSPLVTVTRTAITITSHSLSLLITAEAEDQVPAGSSLALAATTHRKP